MNSFENCSTGCANQINLYFSIAFYIDAKNKALPIGFSKNRQIYIEIFYIVERCATNQSGSKYKHWKIVKNCILGSGYICSVG